MLYFSFFFPSFLNFFYFLCSSLAFISSTHPNTFTLNKTLQKKALFNTILGKMSVGFEKLCTCQALQSFLFLKGLKSFSAADNTMDRCVWAWQVPHCIFIHIFGQKSAKTPAAWATRSLFLGRKCWSFLLFLAPLKIPGDRTVSLCSRCTYCKEDWSVHSQSWALWSQACFIPWRYYDGVCVTPSKSR